MAVANEPIGTLRLDTNDAGVKPRSPAAQRHDDEAVVQPPGLTRRVASVLAGVAAVIVLSTGTDSVMQLIGVFPPWDRPMSDGLFVLATVYRSIYAILGGYVAARFAPAGSRPMRYALAIGIVGLVLCTVGVVATWNAGAELGPSWYSVALVATALPCPWLGGKLNELRRRARAGR